jgi:hypothetical protein
MDKITICNEVKSLAQVPGADITSTVGLNGINNRIVGWVDKAYRKILNLHENWRFLYIRDFHFNCSKDKRSYTLAELAVDDFAKWDLRYSRAYRASTGVQVEERLTPITYDKFADHLSLGRQIPAHPRYIFAYPDDSALALHPIPDDEYRVTLGYWRTPPALGQNDEPVFPKRYHDLIIDLALMYYSIYDDAPEIYVTHEKNYLRQLALMEESELPGVELSYEPIA